MDIKTASPKVGNTIHLRSTFSGGEVKSLRYLVVNPDGQRSEYALGTDDNVGMVAGSDNLYFLAYVPELSGDYKYEVKAVVNGDTITARDKFSVQGYDDFFGPSIKVESPEIVETPAPEIATEPEPEVITEPEPVRYVAIKRYSPDQMFLKASEYFHGSAIKALGDGRVGGYLVVFGGEKDSQGEYFVPEVEFHLDWFNGDTRPILYHHGLLDEDSIEQIGTIQRLTKDATGLYAEGTLDLTSPLAQDVYNMIQRGQIGWSSGSSPHLSHVNPDGGIDEWCIVEASLTPTPAAGKRTTVQAIKFDYSSTVTRPSGAGALVEDAAVKCNPTLSVSTKRGDIMGFGNIIGAMESAGADADMILSVLKNLDGGGETAEASDGMMADPASVPADVEDMASPAEKMVTEGDGGAEIRDTGSKPAMTPPAQTPAPAGASTVKGFTNGINAKEVAAEIGKYFMNLRTEPAAKSAGGFVGQNPARQTGPRITDMRTPFHTMSHEDMAFLYQMRASSRNPRLMGEQFEREMADKAMKAYNGGKLDLDETTHRKVAMKLEFNNTSVAADGASWVPDLWSSALWQRVRIDNNVAKNIEVFQMPSPTFEYPVESTDPTVYAVGESDTDAEQTLATNVFTRSKLSVSKLQFSAKKVGLQVGFSTEIEEDSIIPFIPQLRAQATRAFANAIDNLLLNSDSVTGTGNINYKGANTSAAPTSKFLFGGGDGFRKNALVTNPAVAKNFQGGIPTLQAMRALRFLLINSTQAYGIEPDQLFWVCDPYTWGKLLSIDEINVFMNNGRGATVNSGLVPDIDGTPIFPSAEIQLADSTGYFMNDGSGTLGSLVLVAKNAWKVGYVRQVMSDVSYVPWNDSYILTMTARFAIGKKDTVASGIGYNILVS